MSTNTGVLRKSYGRKHEAKEMPHLCRVPTVFRTWYAPGGRRNVRASGFPFKRGLHTALGTAPVFDTRLKLSPGITYSAGTFSCVPTESPRVKPLRVPWFPR